jgi:hypothetical protein
MAGFQQVMPKHRDKTPELLPGMGVPDIEIERAKAVIAINLANLISVPRGKAEPPDFTDDPSEFNVFIDRNFPRSKFASLRKALDKPSRGGWGYLQRKKRSAAFLSHPFVRVYADEWRASPISFYREVVRVGKVLRAATVVIDAVARLKNTCPPLRICDCGELFVPQRKDQEFCSKTCRDRVRQANWRADQERRDRYKKNRIQKENEREKQRKAR